MENIIQLLCFLNWLDVCHFLQITLFECDPVYLYVLGVRLVKLLLRMSCFLNTSLITVSNEKSRTTMCEVFFKNENVEWLNKMILKPNLAMVWLRVFSVSVHICLGFTKPLRPLSTRTNFYVSCQQLSWYSNRELNMQWICFEIIKPLYHVWTTQHVINGFQ